MDRLIDQPTNNSMGLIRRLFAWGSYPAVMIIGMGFAFWMANKLPLASNNIVFELSIFGNVLALHDADLHKYLMYVLPVFISGIWVYLMERFQSFSAAWRPEWKANIFSDVGLFILNNVLLRAEFFVAIAMAGAAGVVSTWFGVSLWPNDWPLVLQVVLFLVLAEFMTYWLHRLEHEKWLLWRVHCVHHNPDKLYWLNATRFHYFDIIALPVVANVPAIALGADVTVIYLATTFSVMHGFWQHGNADVRFGWLNYIVSSPELHRWHHVKDTSMANHNYGSNLIIWDLVFGTWMLPKQDLEPTEIGVSGVDGGGVANQFLLPFRLKESD
ncbi:hypothetical protein A9Q99_26880 [Gammaproteobacteria bacterium 45_16_T64]|nr:hypothetical protein A9Q99_26880 [Gammaproteobacteria bacterium 45_16_T64]